MKKKLLLSLVLTMITLPVFAGPEDGAGPILPCKDEVTAFSVSEPQAPGIIPDKMALDRPDLGVMIMGGVLGNIAGSLAGVYLGARMYDEHHPLPFISCWAAGSALGSALGVALAGHSPDWQGNFGLAFVGGALGVGASWLILSSPTFQRNAGLLSLVPLAVLPPVGAAIFHRFSLRPRRFPMLGALLSLSAGRLDLGVPVVHVRPLLVPGTDARPEWQFSARLLSVAL